MKKDLIIISVGGSLIVPEEIDVKFLKSFQGLILSQIKRGKGFILICGGGKTARKYQAAAKFFSETKKENLDWLGIQGTIINAYLVKSIFGKLAHPEIIENPTEKINFREKVLVAAGWKPGWSTDYDAVLLAKNFKTQKIVNLTNIDYVYDKNPTKFKNAKPIKKISWKKFRKLFPRRWEPGLSVPFDPVASREAKKLGLEVVVMNGNNFKNLENYLNNKKFNGTEIK